MSGCFSGVQARLKELNPHSLYVHCSNHSLDLILQEAAREVSLVADTLNFVQGVSSVIRESSKRKQLYQSFFEAIDVISAELDRRFDQSSMKLAAKRERAVIKAAEGRSVDLEALQLPEELDTDRLELQLKMLRPSIAKQLADVTKDRGFMCVTVQDVASCLIKLQPQTRAMFSEIEKLIELCLCLPISTWVRSTMTQKRLTHLSLMHTNTDILNSLDIRPLMRDFISTTTERTSTFGHL
ncbi:hypothetical protein ABG768_010656 [Culter alburnus]|uniref:Uncharacterized protein n=1 Tax=Culter alburnus TaxID=194366 RepID=A0AAW1ZCB6_CULAL